MPMSKKKHFADSLFSFVVVATLTSRNLIASRLIDNVL